MNPASRKKLILCLRSGHQLAGFVDPDALLASSRLALLRPEGQRVEVDQEQILAGYFVDEFVRDEELMRAAPRGAVALPGIRMRCRTLDHQTREGLLASDLLGLHEGLELTAPYAECRWQRLYVPRRALEYLAVVGVVRAARQRRQAPQAQISLFSPGGQR